MRTRYGGHWLAPVACALVLLIGTAINIAAPTSNSPGNDIHAVYLEGQNIREGANPYLRTLSGNMRDNDKYPTYFPLFYLVSAGLQSAGLVDYDAWLSFLRWLFLAFNVGCGLLLYDMIYRRKGVLLAVFATLFWFTTRWNLQIVNSVNYSHVAVFFLLLALWLLPRHRLGAGLALGVSLALKQVAVILVPLYLILVWQSTAERRVRATLAAAAAVAGVTAVLCIPFLVWPGASILANADGLFRSVAFSVTRNGAGYVGALSLDMMFDVSGPAARLPLIALLVLLYIAFWQRKIGFLVGSLLSMAVAIDFNPVLYAQYFCWLVPFILLSVVDALDWIQVGRRAPARSAQVRRLSGLPAREEASG